MRKRERKRRPDADKPAPLLPLKGAAKGSSKTQSKAPAAEKSDLLKIETDGMQERIVMYRCHRATMHLGWPEKVKFSISSGLQTKSRSAMRKYNVKDRKDEEVMELDSYIVSADRKKMLYMQGVDLGITPAGKKPEPGKGVLNTGAISVRIDPLEEWPQIFDEAWRVNRDYFYDPGMHGADWKAMKEKYSQFLPHLTCSSDLNRVIQWMCSELGVGHHSVGGGDRLNNPRGLAEDSSVPTSRLKTTGTG
jgi:tricorn protease